MLDWNKTKVQRERNEVGFIAIFCTNTEGEIKTSDKDGNHPDTVQQ